MADSSDVILARLLDLHPRFIDLRLDRILAFLDDLGGPQNKLPPVIHVAGTNGKGSVVACLRAILEAAGLRVHCYTSPHLVRFHERIVLAGLQIEESNLRELLDECEQVNAGRPITFFEIITAAAFLAFSREPADVVVLETGLGGRLDATNVVTKPLMSVLTPIDIDHEYFLGDTLEAIAAEKAAIIKPDVPAISSLQRPKAAGVLKDRAAEVGVKLDFQDENWSVSTVGQTMAVRVNGRRRVFAPPALEGDHQVRNAGLAVAALLTQDRIDIPDVAFNKGLRSVRWPGRFQKLKSGPLVDLLREGQSLWIDGGHNAAAAGAIVATLKTWRPTPIHLIVGMLKSRTRESFLKPLGTLDAPMTLVAIPDEENTWQAKALLREAEKLGLLARAADGFEAAVTEAARSVGPNGRILVCGSLFLCGHVLRNHA